MDDLISRETAIDALENNRFPGAPHVDTGVEIAIRIIKELPSAQPVITCDGCRFVGTYDTDFPCCSCVRREKDYYEPER